MLPSWTGACLLHSKTFVEHRGKRKRACDCLPTLDQCLCMAPADAKESLQLHCGFKDGHLQADGIARQLCRPHWESLSLVFKHVGSAQDQALRSHVLDMLSRAPHLLVPRTIKVDSTDRRARRFAGAQVRNSTSPQAGPAGTAVTTTGGGATHSTPQQPVPSAQTGDRAATGGDSPPKRERLARQQP